MQMRTRRALLVVAVVAVAIVAVAAVAAASQIRGGDDDYSGASDDDDDYSVIVDGYTGYEGLGSDEADGEDYDIDGPVDRMIHHRYDSGDDDEDNDDGDDGVYYNDYVWTELPPIWRDYMHPEKPTTGEPSSFEPGGREWPLQRKSIDRAAEGEEASFELPRWQRGRRA